MNIRLAKFNEAGKISKLILKTLSKINKKDYAKKQYDLEIKWHTIKKIKEVIKNNKMFVAIINNKIVGVINIDLKNKHIDRFYVKYDLIRRGIGKQLIDFVEDYAKDHGIKSLIVYPTPYAKSFYKKYGYKKIRVFMGTMNGGFPVTEMRKKLIN